MTDDERDRWDTRYASGDYTPRTRPTPFLADWLPRIPVGRALDVATGTGRNAFLLADAGFEVDAVDISAVAIEAAAAASAGRGTRIRWQVADLDDATLPDRHYDLITVLRYRNPALWPRLIAALAPDGWLLVEHHLQTHADAVGPRDPAFRLAPQELLRAFADLRVIHYRERLEPADRPEETYAIARLVACNGDPGF